MKERKGVYAKEEMVAQRRWYYWAGLLLATLPQMLFTVLIMTPSAPPDDPTDYLDDVSHDLSTTAFVGLGIAVAIVTTAGGGLMALFRPVRLFALGLLSGAAIGLAAPLAAAAAS